MGNIFILIILPKYFKRSQNHSSMTLYPGGGMNQVTLKNRFPIIIIIITIIITIIIISDSPPGRNAWRPLVFTFFCNCV